jgi:two-component system, sensor histidine kinase PdtaS
MLVVDYGSNVLPNFRVTIFFHRMIPKNKISCILFAFWIAFHFAEAQQQSVIDSLRLRYSIVQDKQERFAILDELVMQWVESDIDSSNYYANKMVRLANEIGKPSLISKALLRRGTAFDYFSRFDSALVYYQKSLAYSRAYQDSTGIANALFSLAIVQQLQGNNLEAIDQYLEVEKMFKSLGDRQRLSRLYNNLGNMYKKTEQYDVAIQVFENSIEIKQELGDAKGILNTSINLAMLYSAAGRHEDAIALSVKNLEQVQRVGDTANEISLLINLGVIYSNDKNPKRDLTRGLSYLQMAEKLLKDNSSLTLQVECWVNLAGINQSLNNPQRASSYLAKLETILGKISPEARISYYELKVNEMRDLGDFKGAFSFLEKKTDAQHQLVSDKLMDRAAELEVRYETEKKERVIAQLELDKQKASLEIITGANQRNLLIAVSIGLFAISGLIYFQFRQKHKSNSLLTEKNSVIEKSLRERESLLKEIHHRVKNNLQIISSLLSLQSRSLTDTDAQGAISESRNRVKSMSLIHEQLYQEDTISGVDMKDYIQRLVNSLVSSYGLDTERVEIKIAAENILLDVDSAIPLGLIINELVSNSIKYAFPEKKSGTILVSLHEMMSELKLKVEDNGVGMDVSKKSNQSFGLSMVNSLMRKLKAEMNIVSSEGTSVELVIRDFKKVGLG